MQCIECKHKNVCKHFAYMMDNMNIGIQINDCKEFFGEDDSLTPFVPKKQKPVELFEKTVEDNPVGYTDFSKFSKQISSIQAMPVEVSKVTCDRCKKEVFTTEVDNCIECGRPVCIDCRVNTFDPDTGIVTATCEKCWSGEEDPILGEESKVSISYAEENNEWDLKDFEETKKEVDAVKEEKDEGDSKPKSKQVGSKRPNKKSK